MTARTFAWATALACLFVLGGGPGCGGDDTTTADSGTTATDTDTDTDTDADTDTDTDADADADADSDADADADSDADADCVEGTPEQVNNMDCAEFCGGLLAAGCDITPDPQVCNQNCNEFKDDTCLYAGALWACIKANNDTWECDDEGGPTLTTCSAELECLGECKVTDSATDKNGGGAAR